LAAVGALASFLHHSRIAVALRNRIVVALGKRLADPCQLVRIAAMGATETEPGEAGSSRADDVRLYEQTSLVNPVTNHKAKEEMAYKETLHCLKRLLHDPSPTVRMKVSGLLALCRARGGVRNLARCDATNLIRTLNNTGPTSECHWVACQEAIWAFRWLSKQWRFREDDYNDEDEPDWLKDELTVPRSILKMREKIGQLSEAPLEEVLSAMQNRDIAVRLAALGALLKIRSTGEGVIDYVVDMLHDPCQQVRWRTEETLTDMVFNKVTARPAK
jgi:hypothetical protein